MKTPKHTLENAEQMPLFAKADWNKVEWHGLTDHLRKGQRRLDAERFAQKVKAAAAKTPSKLGTVFAGADKAFVKLEKGLGALRRETTARVKKQFTSGQGGQPDAAKSSGAPAFQSTRKLGRVLTLQADRILRKAEGSLKTHRETGQWHWTTLPGTPGEAAGGAGRKIAFQKKKAAGATATKASRGFSYTKQGPKAKKVFEPIANVKEGKAAGIRGVEWLLDHEKQDAPGHATRVKGFVKIPAAVAAAGLVDARLTHLKKTNPKRYKQERAIAVAGVGLYGAYKVAKTAHDVVKRFQHVKGAF